jgi:very-short-patch-repair endonuclease/cellulose biosynthesis protein BcsQ
MSFLTARDRAIRLFEFLKEYAAVRFPYVRDLKEIRWMLWLAEPELPTHPSITVYRFAWDGQQEEPTSSAPEVLIRIRRPNLSSPPKPPASLQGWIQSSYDDPFKEPRVLSELSIEDSAGGFRILRFDENETRVRDWESWLHRWQAWAPQEQLARRAMKVYELFHSLYGELQREGERYELVLADGILSWNWGQGSIYFPLILMPVQLEFDATVPEFTVRETGRNPELYTAPLRDAPLLNPEILSSLHRDMEQGAELVHPLEFNQTTAFLRRLAPSLAPRGEYVGERVPEREAGQHPPRIGRTPLLFLRPRSQGYSRAVELILEDLRGRGKLPPALSYVTGLEPSAPRDESPWGREDEEGNLERVLFTKSWNREQIRIASRLQRFDCVVVQGPPGTGKTHTIANLIGHLLAQGKSVLVTAYTTKALRVVREKIVDSLRSLAVSLLDDDLASRKQLEEAVLAITERLSAYDAAQLHREADGLEQERRDLLQEIGGLRQQLTEAVESEYRTIVVGGREYQPAEAARRVAEGAGRDDWIPPPVQPGAPLPLGVEEIIELYGLNRELPAEDEREMEHPIPDPETLLDPDEFERQVAFLREPVLERRPEWWEREPEIDEVPQLLKVARQARALGQRILDAEAWQLALVEVGEDRSVASMFEEFFRQAEEVARLVTTSTELIIAHDPMLASDWPLEEQERIARELAQVAIRRGGRLVWWDLLSDQRRRFLRSVRVSAGRPKTAEHFRALAEAAAIQIGRKRLRTGWNYLVTKRGGPEPEVLGQEPERFLIREAPRLRQWLYLADNEVGPLRTRLQELGLVWGQAYREPTLEAEASTRWKALGQFLTTQLAQALEAEAHAVQQEHARRQIVREAERLGEPAPGTTIAALWNALRQLDPDAYRVAHARLRELYNKQTLLRRRKELLARLERRAPGWANAIRQRLDVHGESKPPGDPEAAWTWRQLYDELLRRGHASVQELQTRLRERMEHLYRVTAELVERRAWAYRLEKTTHEQQQALVGWFNTIRRLGKGTGRQAPRLRAEAARLIAKAKEAVPVWIMPLARVVEQFDPRTTRFDVVIIDEASQCDILGLIALYLGRQVVVVGDHEQVSPEGVGQELDRIRSLQEEYLQGIPNWHLYDGRRSIYDIAREAFGGSIMLVEHFRCVPEIIQFSNKLCYQGRIRPVRDSSRVSLKPPVVPHRVRGVSFNRRNEAEALAIASLVVAMMRHPAYEGKTIGVISMVGDDQARYIEQLLQRFRVKDPREFERRRFLCGNPAHFQGDERDVVLISLVDGPEGPGKPLPMRNDDRFKQRFNVAASRARDQLWVVYSLDPAADLKKGDLRRELIEYALQIFRDPKAIQRMQEEVERTESPFEREVFEWLVRTGYRVRTQWPASGYRIDLVVESSQGRVAIECDGDRWHPLEKIREDLERQADLERQGWRFIRIRGSEFYRDREGTMQRVRSELERMGIQPEHRTGEPEDDWPAPGNALVDEIRRMADEIKDLELAGSNKSREPSPPDWRQ